MVIRKIKQIGMFYDSSDINRFINIIYSIICSDGLIKNKKRANYRKIVHRM
jgi:hypothetical protein